MKRKSDSERGSVTGSRVQTTLDRAAGPVVLMVVAAITFLLLLHWDHWFLNFDGGSYMALAKSIKEGQGFRFPDGSFATFRGPVYSTYLALGWIITPTTVKSAIWISRMVLVVNAVVMADLARRFTGRLWLAAVAGLLIAVQPLPLISGGMFLVPDALAAFFVLISLWVWAGPRPLRTSRMVSAGLLLGLAFLTKETAALGLLIPLVWDARVGGARAAFKAVPALILGWSVPVGAWVLASALMGHRLPDWLDAVGVSAAWLALAVALAGLGGWILSRRDLTLATRPLNPFVGFVVVFLTSVLALVVVGVPFVRPIGELGVALQKDWDRWLYLGTPRTWLLVAFVPALIWALGRRRRPEVVVSVALVAVGFAQLVHAALAQLGPRNGVLFAYGGVLVVVLWVGAMWSSPRLNVLVRLGSLAAVVLVLWVSSQATTNTDNRFDYKGLTWDATAVRNAVSWLERSDLPVIGTPDYLSYMWFLRDEDANYELIQFYVSRPTGSGEAPSFDRLASWAGSESVTVPSLTQPLGGTVARSGTSLVVLDSILGAGERRPTLVVVSGNLETSAAQYDGGVLLPFMEAQQGARRVYQSSLDELPQWLVIYEVDAPLVASSSPTLVHVGIDAPVPTVAEEQIVVDDVAYRDMIEALLSQPTP